MLQVLYRRRFLLLFIITVLAFTLRIYRLDAAGFSEDESHKIEAVRAYQQGEYQANAEHPMLMKIAVTASVTAIEELKLPISTETALRLPNVIFGSLITIILYLFFNNMFGFRIGILTATLWAININAIFINRIVKEDTMLVFFAWLGYYFCRRAKWYPEAELKRHFYRLTGISFGLMFASKYFPHYAGLNFLYYHLLGKNAWNERIKLRYYIAFFSALILTFIIANPVIFWPDTLSYLISYMHENMQTHHGYWMMEHLYYNDASSPRGSTPSYFYLLAIAVKTPLPLFFAMLLGLFEIFRQRNNDSYFFLKFMLLLWLIPFSFIGAKWLRYTLSLTPPLCAIMALGLSIAYDRIRDWWQKQIGEWTPSLRAVLIVVSVVIFLGFPIISALRFAPFYSLYVSPLAGGSKYIGYYFPQDEFYDLGLREAVLFIANEAAANTTIVSEAPSVVNHYKQVFGRPDLQSAVMSAPNFQFMRPSYVLIQDGRRYFENIKAINFVENSYQPIKEVKIYGVTAVKIYKLSESEQNLPSVTSSVHNHNNTLVIQ